MGHQSGDIKRNLSRGTVSVTLRSLILRNCLSKEGLNQMKVKKTRFRCLRPETEDGCPFRETLQECLGVTSKRRLPLQKQSRENFCLRLTFFPLSHSPTVGSPLLSKVVSPPTPRTPSRGTYGTSVVSRPRKERPRVVFRGPPDGPSRSEGREGRKIPVYQKRKENKRRSLKTRDSEVPEQDSVPPRRGRPGSPTHLGRTLTSVGKRVQETTRPPLKPHHLRSTKETGPCREQG